MLIRYVSDYRNNFINFNDEEYDQAVNEAITSLDGEEQEALYKRAEVILSEQAASVWLQDLCDLVAMRQGLTGLVFYPTFVLDLSTIGWTA